MYTRIIDDGNLERICILVVYSTCIPQQVKISNIKNLHQEGHMVFHPTARIEVGLANWSHGLTVFKILYVILTS